MRLPIPQPIFGAIPRTSEGSLPTLNCTSFKIGRKHKAHRGQPPQGKNGRIAEKGRNKNRGKVGRHGKMGQDESHMVDENTPPETLKSRTLEAVAEYIKDGRARRIVVMTGAGISTSAGIPDFRSPDTGLYANLARLDLPYAEAVFDIGYFRKNPLPFYTLAQELYPGNYRPTITHSFINLLHQKGLLLKLFTQNIDCLEREASVPGDKIVEAHGSFARQSCIECKTPYPQDLMKKAIAEKTVPTCIQETCDGLVKPEIVFFGEQLPADFFENRSLPSEADLCIVMGTSLSVHPFASLPMMCSQGTPRVLINSEQVGDMGSRADDVLLIQDCDAGVRSLAKACGWLEELEGLWAQTARPGQPEAKKAEEAAKTGDERLQDEIDKLTKEIDKNLQVTDDQHTWLDNHVDTKFARIPDDGLGDGPTAPVHPGREPNPQETRHDTTPDESDPTDDGLRHVFPWLEKKSSL
ncbi:NAD-dependent deacetylase sirtuin-2 [Bimuria novae-zelandiae CBS 107.79]|uniref:NAD-dependent deacetylase sirtuin-2 n=1 Tax=Bimuria novae-zelandiae CBS 107.79 TaxID=1447943 RepID=A0A6A5VVJ4_9PLEO|nr:NAD-dependent deacetylase sirtuin-2 [Bimuria novae-zelandiae CBS 107.79]